MSTPIDRPRIFSHLTRTRFLHIEDALGHGNPGERRPDESSVHRGKLRFFIGAFERGQGAVSMAYAFLDVEDARVVLSDLSWGKAIEFIDFKGGKDGKGMLSSRVLKILTSPVNLRPAETHRIWIELRNGPGEELSGGGVKPKGKATVEISIPLTVFEGRKLAHACLAYLHAWDVQKQIAAVGSEPSKTRVITDW